MKKCGECKHYYLSDVKYEYYPREQKKIYSCDLSGKDCGCKFEKKTQLRTQSHIR